MGLRISTNVAAINTQRNMTNSQRLMQNSSAQLASGFRINKAADDAAGLAISETMRGQIRSAIQAKRNANDAISLVQTAEGGLGEISNILIRSRELAIQAASDTIGDNERSLIQTEISQLKDEVQRIAKSTRWNSTSLLDGSTPTFDFQIGIFSTESDQIAFDATKNVGTLDALGLTDMDFSKKDSARSSISAIETAQQNVNAMRANLGALQNRMTSTVDTLAITEENLAAANSRIRDTDVASSTSDMARNNVLLQAGTATLAQANQSTQLALKLIG
ncbi:flagellin [Pseudobdellovibrio sp. HCB154]|uniref:flagellin N-terminal helical domain-containing protein n=1 Tax=Pseudobdellovibrio sp. HCB154 TaxID=3386277 RepID=UPI003916DF79